MHSSQLDSRGIFYGERSPYWRSNKIADIMDEVIQDRMAEFQQWVRTHTKPCSVINATSVKQYYTDPRQLFKVPKGF